MTDMAVEPEIVVPNHDELTYLLTEAAEIEHGLMCCYLFAAQSLHRGPRDGITEAEAVAVERWRAVITGVAIEEMLHLALVSNLLSAIGSSPHLQRPNFPVVPGYHPSGVVVALAPFDVETMNHFIYLERPEGSDLADSQTYERPPAYERVLRADRLMPSAQDYATAGHLYRGIRAGLVHLARELGEAGLFVGDPRAQVDGAVASLPGLIPVTDLASALRAVDLIVEQGEGSTSNPEGSHFRRFVGVRDELKDLSAARPDFAPAWPVARSPVLRRPPDPRGKTYVDHPTTSRVLDLGCSVYTFALRCLARAFGHADDPAARQLLIGASLESMRLLAAIGELLCRLPASETKPGVTSGLSFTMQRSQLGFSQPAAAWPLLGRRAREIAAASELLATDDARSLESVGHAFAAIAERLEARAEPSRITRPKPDSSLQAPTVPAAEPRAVVQSAAPIEEAKGAKLLLRFEGKRCIHSRRCVLGAPDVFLANVEGSWLRPDAMDVESLVAIAHECPSGAITYERLDGRPDEEAPPVNVLRLRENGPLALHADIEMAPFGRMFRATLCRCGKSKNKPFCDSAHKAAPPFVATGEPSSQPGEPLAARTGLLHVVPTTDGPLEISGNLEICSGTGRTVARVERARLCRCGGSSNKPFCDSTHLRNGFRSDA
jgi:CDGSH-type Zn-finger protein/uncharacterized Fe-S cluster protein YjdI